MQLTGRKVCLLANARATGCVWLTHKRHPELNKIRQNANFPWNPLLESHEQY